MFGPGGACLRVPGVACNPRGMHVPEAEEGKGSMSRCHWRMDGEPDKVAGLLRELAEPRGYVSADDLWMPQNSAV